jgi:hypothetical protein
MGGKNSTLPDIIKIWYDVEILSSELYRGQVHGPRKEREREEE